jgi:tRNA threonylcarbamoyladenosine biosynthesis protein TsaB
MMVSTNLLGLETATRRAAVAVARGAKIFVSEPDPNRRHGQGLLPAVRDLLHQAGLAAADLDAIAVGRGPGSFTGLRVGVTAAKTLAYALDKPLVGLDSLELIAQNAPAQARRVAVVADAQRGDVFAADFARDRPAGPLRRVAPTRVEPRDCWLDHLTEGVWVLGPDLEPLVARLPPFVVAAPELGWPQGRGLIDLARAAFQAGRHEDFWFLEPVYLRRSAAEEVAPPSPHP